MIIGRCVCRRDRWEWFIVVGPCRDLHRLVILVTKPPNSGLHLDHHCAYNWDQNPKVGIARAVLTPFQIIVLENTMQLLRVFLVYLILYAFQTGAGFGQTDASASAALIRQNQRLTLLNQVAPEIVPTIVIRLKRIGDRIQDTPRGNAQPTPSEVAQINSNPAFREAYSRDPTETLSILRYVNEILRSAGR